MSSAKKAALKKRLGEILIEVGMINDDQLRKALDLQKTRGGKIGSILMGLNYITEDVLLAFLARQMGIPFVSMEEYSSIRADVLSTIPEQVVRRQNILPVTLEGNSLTVAMSNPLDVIAMDELKMLTGKEVKMVIASSKEIRAAIQKYYDKNLEVKTETESTVVIPPPNLDEANVTMTEIIEDMARSRAGELETVEETPAGDLVTLSTEAGTAPIIKIVNVLINNAIKARASDIHIEPFEKTVKIRYRMDGVLYPQPAPPKRFHNAISSRIKIMAQLNIAERRLPQDGQIKIRALGREMTLRVSCLPTSFGEKIVMRILDTASLKVGLEQLGFETDQLETWQKLIQAPNGIILVTGPTGSGKSTTLYSSLAVLNTPDTNIMTIEDPVEYMLDGINQVQARPDIGLTFSAGLRSFLRQDPDIILVGEIRDEDTAQIAINAALTGHLVFSTLHTNDAPTSVTRLNNMGVEPYLTASTVIGVVAQRLIRMICQKCRKPEVFPIDAITPYGLRPEQLGQPGAKEVTLYRGQGCDECIFTGYKGRRGVMELMLMSDSIRELVMKRLPHTHIKHQARLEGMRTLRDSAIYKMLSGTTTLDEVLRVTQEDSPLGLPLPETETRAEPPHLSPNDITNPSPETISDVEA